MKTIIKTGFIAGIISLCLATSPTWAADKATDSPTDSSDTSTSAFIWQAYLEGGHYMVSISRICSVSRHKYMLESGLLVDEVDIDTLGCALVRFYVLTPLTSETEGSGVGRTLSKITERGRDIIDKAADRVGTNAQNMVIKKFPETTHSKTIEYRLSTTEELTSLYKSITTSFSTGKGRTFRSN